MWEVFISVGWCGRGKVEHESDDQGRADWEFQADGITELFDTLDTLAVDTIPGGPRSLPPC